MQINFNTVLKTLDGKAIQQGEKRCATCGRPSDEEDLTLEEVAIVALFNTKPEVPAKEKLDRFVLAQRIKQSSVVDLSAEDITTIRNGIAESYGPLVYGRASEILDPQAVSKLVSASKVGSDKE